MKNACFARICLVDWKLEESSVLFFITKLGLPLEKNYLILFFLEPSNKQMNNK